MACVKACLLVLGLLQHHLPVDIGQGLGHALQLLIAVPYVPLALGVIGRSLGSAFLILSCHTSFEYKTHDNKGVYSGCMLPLLQ